MRVIYLQGCGDWQVAHVLVNDSMPMHVWEALTDISELLKEEEGPKVGGKLVGKQTLGS